MDKFFLKFSPYIILASVLLLHAMGYLLDVALRGHFIILIWSAVALIDMIFGYYCGKTVQSLHRKSLNDTLTGLGNRSLFYLEFSHKINNPHKSEFPISLLMLDLDNFKSINDTYGHATGDNILVELAAILKQNTRSTDTVVRWGGEEFTVILPGTSNNDSVLIAERIRKNVENHKFYFGDVLIRTTVSIGICICNSITDIDSIVKMADNALYKAKEKKNSVIVWNESQSYKLQIS